MSTLIHGKARFAIGFTVLVLIAYVIECVAYYSRYFDATLKFSPPGRPFAIEDVLGFGFGVTWVMFAIAFALGVAYWWKIRASKTSLLITVVGVFVIVSMVDLALYKVVERQVLAM
jgi:hypothetical protein